MALPSSGQISISQANAEFGYGKALSNYRGKIWGKANNTSGLFSSTALSMSSLYGTAAVVGNSTGETFASNGTFTVKPYRTMTVALVGGGGGGTGSNGSYYNGGYLNGTVTAGSSGSSGGDTSFGSFVSASGGGPSAAGTSNTVTLTSPVLGGSGPVPGSTVSVTVGAGGAGGAGGSQMYWNGNGYYPVGNASSGANGATGSAKITWT